MFNTLSFLNSVSLPVRVVNQSEVRLWSPGGPMLSQKDSIPL
uniref:Uncharacterized protein n=1 Tax=Utricularia reniformis TaxID=192314 RepID=A0A1Y0B3G0_9LAMI|nr:hypothetical protein AEK19_MT1740 [Utricularia reniformis]ART31917.1 hypothetical protein AEK19_MT1740 [Utricularia reniformis]